MRNCHIKKLFFEKNPLHLVQVTSVFAKLLLYHKLLFLLEKLSVIFPQKYRQFLLVFKHQNYCLVASTKKDCLKH